MLKGEVIGKGRTAEVIYWGNNKVLKLFYKKISSEYIDYQYKVDSIVGNIFPKCPKTFDRIVENNRIGIIYEYIEGTELREFMGKSIKSISKFLKRLAELHVEMHENEINNINSQFQHFENGIQRTDSLDANQKREIIKYLKMLPDGNVICHGDFHVENVIISKNTLYVMDWSNAYSGNQNGDVARTYYVLKHGLAPSDEIFLKKSFLHRFLFKRIKSLTAKIYIKHYMKLSGISLKDIRMWDLVVYAARLSEPIPLEYDNLLKMIKKLL